MIQIREKNDSENWDNILSSFYKSLTSPLDGMWDELIHSHGQLWGIYNEDQLIGYCSKDGDGNLINFFLEEKYSNFKTELFKRTLFMLETRQAIVSTNNPDFLVVSLDRSKKMNVHSYLFENEKEVEINKPVAAEGLDFGLATDSDLNNLIDFCQNNVAADSNWLKGYLERLIERKEIHFLKNGENIIGSCEIRESLSQTDFADLGVIVDSTFQRKGIGSWLIAKAKEIALANGKTPICSCEYANLGSRKMIENAGFSSNNMVLKISF